MLFARGIASSICPVLLRLLFILELPAGGVRLMTAALHRFHRLCADKGVSLPPRGFSMRYHTTVPRQVGLAGSSAIVTAIVRALMAHYGAYGTRPPLYICS